jgi:hypothetical protein
MNSSDDDDVDIESEPKEHDNNVDIESDPKKRSQQLTLFSPVNSNQKS